MRKLSQFACVLDQKNFFYTFLPALAEMFNRV